MFLRVHNSEPDALAVSSDLCGVITGALLAPAALHQKPNIPRQLSLLECEQRPGAARRRAQIQR